MKSILVVNLILIIAIFLFSGCDQNDKTDKQNNNKQNNQTNQNEENNDNTNNNVENSNNTIENEQTNDSDNEFEESENYKVYVIKDYDFSKKDNISSLSKNENVTTNIITEDSRLFPSPHADNVLSIEGGKNIILSDSLGEIQDNSIYAVSFYTAINSLSNLGSVTVDIINNKTDKTYKSVMSWENVSFKLNNYMWNRVFIYIDTNDIENFNKEDGLRFEIKARNVYIDSLMTTRRKNTPESFYVSSSSGNKDGFATYESPINSTRPISATKLLPGDNVYIKSADTFNEVVYFQGKGTSDNPINISSYEGDKRPLFYLGQNKLTDVIFTYENASFVNISNINFKDAKIGLYLRYYKDYENKDVRVENCLFENMDDIYCNPSEYQNELGFSSGIYLSGLNPGGKSNVIDGLTLVDNMFEYCTSGFNTNWFYFDTNSHPRDIVRNIHIDGGHAKASSVAGSLLIQWSDGVTIRNFRQFGNIPKAYEEWFVWGSTGLMIGSSKNILIEKSEFSDANRFSNNEELLKEMAEDPDVLEEYARKSGATGNDLYLGLHWAFSGDASGIDIDGNNENVTFRNNVVHSNDGAGLQLLSTLGPHRNVLIENSTFYNNGTNVKNKWIVEDFYWDGNKWVIEYNKNRYLFGGDAWEIKLDRFSTGRIDNVNMYRSKESFGWISTSGSSFRIGETGKYMYEDIKDLPKKQFFNVSGITDGSNNEYIEIEDLFINSFRTPYLYIDMTLNDMPKDEEIMIKYITDLDREYNNDKVMFAKVSDGNVSSINIHNDDFPGVIVGVRIYPSKTKGVEYAFKGIEFSKEEK